MLALASLCVLAQTQQPAPNTDTARASSTGTITGQVVNENGQPLPNALVQIRAVRSAAGQTVVTDREGEFQINGLEPVDYSISAWMPSYTVANPESLRRSNTYRVGDRVKLTLIKGGVVTGKVINAEGDPVVTVNVRAQMVRDANGRVVRNGPTRERQTDDRGIYRIYGLPAGTYVVVAGGPSPHSSSSTPPVFEFDVPTYAPASSRDMAAEISVRAGEEVADVDIRYRGEQGRVISGEVTVAASSHRGFSVMLTTDGDASAQWATTSNQSADNRSFVFNGIADGDYSVFAQSYSQNGELAVSESKRIAVRGADVTGVKLTAKLLGSVAGRVVLEETKAPECTDKDDPLSQETFVFAWHNDNEAAKQIPQSVWSLGAPGRVDDDGNFLVRNLAPGEYYFAPRFNAPQWYVQSIAFVPAATAATKAKPVNATRVWTNVKAGDKLSGLTITLAQGAASLRGQLVLPEGEQTPARTIVYLVPVEREKADDVLRFFAAPVRSDGQITLNNIPPGRYWVLAQVVGEDIAALVTKLRMPHETAIRARSRRDAEAAKNEIEFKPCQNITDFRLAFKATDQ